MKKILKSAATTTLIASLAVLLPVSAQAEKVLRFAHDNKADMLENPAHAFTGVFKNIVESASNGAIKVEVYPSNQLGSAKEHVQMVRDGQIQGTLASVGALAGFYPRISVLDVPFAFSSNAATYEVFDGDFGKTLARDIESTMGDVKVLGFPDTGGFFSVTNSKQAINKLEDFQGVRIRTMTLPTHQKIIQALGGEAYPLAWGEVYSSLQTGVIDGQMNPVPTVTFAKFNEVQKYLTLTNHLFAPYTLLLNRDFYDSLSAEERNIIHFAVQSGIVAGRGVARVIEASDRGLAGLKDSMEINALSAEEHARFREATQPVLIDSIRESQDDTGDQLLEMFLSVSQAANQQHYLQ
ncbi:TRAP transporter substrate-binding protein [Balneatrix alpica]|uniref:TRAP transporter substrate-binding protein n=1 Tax=Balneatrix alpica TaxID=75684 RepID=UPI002739F5F1|nr:DctP family TRAP transporter solute-binding subunit [Balneatrix alpica]